jgi:hypothetical protein
VTTKSNVNVLMLVTFGGVGLLTFLWTVLSLVDRLDHAARSPSASH